MRWFLGGFVLFALVFAVAHAYIAWLYLAAGFIALTRRVVRLIRRVVEHGRRERARAEAARAHAGHLRQVVDARRAVRDAAISHATRRAA